jgi:hypothetical protein
MYKFRYYNPNPLGKSVGDCTIRAVTKLTGFSWDDVFWDVAHVANSMADMPSSNAAWGEYLLMLGYHKIDLAGQLPIWYTINDFCMDNPKGKYLLGTGTHAVCVVDGYYYDAWNSGNERPTYLWTKERW